MMIRAICVLSVFVSMQFSAGIAAGNHGKPVPAGIADANEENLRLLASAMLPMLPPEQRQAIIRAGGLGSEDSGYRVDRAGEILVAHDERYATLREFVSPSLFARMKDEHISAMLHSLERAASDQPPIAMCFAPDTDPELAMAFSELFKNEFWNGASPDEGTRFQIGPRWSATAVSPGTGTQGTPITLTYSFAPDGAIADNLSGMNRINRLHEWLNFLYGSPDVWQGLFEQVFLRWSELIGITYKYEPNDDGVEANTLPGELGVRGDVRIFAVALDGNSGVLAYNAFPNNGDMVFDAFDSFFNNTTYMNSLGLRNVIAHEHGHGMGIFHVCPGDQTKIMEPMISLAYDGPQLDDILAGQRSYGDPNEHNDNAATATPLGDWAVGSSGSVSNVSIDDSDDIDFYRINVTEQLDIVVDVDPDAAFYVQGPQTEQCDSGDLTNYNSMQEFRVSIVDSDGSTTLHAVESSSIFDTSVNLRYTIDSPGTYYIVVDDSTNNNSIQRYRMDIVGETLTIDGPTIVAQQNAPGLVLPGVPVTLDFEVLANQDTISSGPDLHYRFDNGPYTAVPLSPVGGDIYRATIPPAACGDSPMYYISVSGDSTGQVYLPEGGQSAPFTYEVGTLLPVFEDNFEQDLGWDNSVNTASLGMWDRGIPVASVGAPPSDYDGSGQCYLTGNSSNESVDAGRVFLLSPPIDLNAGGQFTYAYWFSSGTDSFDGDTLKVEMSTDGQLTWQTMRTYSTDSNGWQTDYIDVSAAQGVANTRFRFVVHSTGEMNIVEAAVDQVRVGPVECIDPVGCNPADIAEPYDTLDLTDITTFISAFLAEDPIADLVAPFGTFDLADITEFVIQFGAGCP